MLQTSLNQFSSAERSVSPEFLKRSLANQFRFFKELSFQIALLVEFLNIVLTVSRNSSDHQSLVIRMPNARTDFYGSSGDLRCAEEPIG